MTHHSVIIVGGGQAGLSASYLLNQRDVDHVVLERHRVGHAWREQRWDTFCLVTPNWQCQLPGHPYPGPDPRGFMVKDDIVRYLEGYAAAFRPPIREGVDVRRLTRLGDGTFQVETVEPGGRTVVRTADAVIVAVGNYHTPVVPRVGERLPPDVVQVHSAQYKRPDQLPPGAVLVVGTGQSGCQIAEDLHLAGRKVHLCVGSAPRVARRYRGRDVVDWLADMGYYDMPVDHHPEGAGVRRRANHYVTGRDGGRDIDLRQRAVEGMQLYGRLADVRPLDGGGAQLTFGPDLRANLDRADEISENIKTSIDKHIAKHGVDAPTEPRYTPVWHPPAEPVTSLDLRAAGITSVVWSVGYHSDFRWVQVPVFDGNGYPGHERGVTAVAGLYFLGLPWLYTWGSGRFSGVARDAEYVVNRIVAAATGGVAAIAGRPVTRPESLEPVAMAS
jgi:putative flavoprotein involved in K+ transport